MTGTDGKSRKNRNTSQKFGIISRPEEAHIVRKMGVTGGRIVGIQGLNPLLAHMSAGDALCIPTVSSFASGAYDLFCKMQYLSGRGIEFQSGNERYLNFSSVRPLSAVEVETLKFFASREAEFSRWVQCSKLPDVAKASLVKRIQAEYLANVVAVFYNSGIKKRGN